MTNSRLQATDELARREQDESVAYEKTLAGQWGMTNAETDERGDSRKTRFNNEVVPKMAVKVQLITKQFQDMVGRFLTMLTVHKDPNLRFLSFRIDFNEVRAGMRNVVWVYDDKNLIEMAGCCRMLVSPLP